MFVYHLKLDALGIEKDFKGQNVHVYLLILYSQIFLKVHKIVFGWQSGYQNVQEMDILEISFTHYRVMYLYSLVIKYRKNGIGSLANNKTN